MNIRRLSANWDLARRTNTVLLLVVFVLAVTVLYQQIQLSGTHERIVLVPPHLDERMEVGWTDASLSYLKSWALSMALLIGNITPSNVDFVVKQLSPFFAPRIYQEIRKKILALKEDPLFKDAKAVNFFSADDIQFEPGTKRVFVKGKLTTSTLTQSRPKIEYAIYEFRFEMRSGLPLVIEFDSYPGTQPHTSKWRAVHQAEMGGGQ